MKQSYEVEQTTVHPVVSKTNAHHNSDLET